MTKTHQTTDQSTEQCQKDTIFSNLKCGNFLASCAARLKELVPITLKEEMTLQTYVLQDRTIGMIYYMYLWEKLLNPNFIPFFLLFSNDKCIFSLNKPIAAYL